MINHHENNQIFSLTSRDGNHLVKNIDMEVELVSFYQDTLSEGDQIRSKVVNQVISHIPFLITLDQNATLMR